MGIFALALLGALALSACTDSREFDVTNESDATVLVQFSVLEDSGEAFRQLVRLEPGRSISRRFGERDDPERWIVTDPDGALLLTIVMGWDEIKMLNGSYVIR